LAVGSKAVFTLGANAMVSIGTPFLVVPMAYFRRTIIPFNPVYNAELNLYTVACAKVSSLPGIRFSIGKDYDYTVPAEKFAVKMTAKTGPVCALLIMQGKLEWIIGSQFLPKQCIHFDYANTVISVADPVT
ncbi:cathepsin D, partial [Aphelenchoides avenae]